MTRKIILSAVITALSAITVFAQSPVETYGRLFADGNRIVGEFSDGEAVQLKGPSLQWSVAGWGSDVFFREETVNAMIDGWNAQIIRAPLGIDYNNPPGHEGVVTGGYLSQPEANWERVKTVVDATIARGVYAIVDWHSHTAHDPDETQKAIEFFTSPDLAGRYGNNPAVIFEIYNEPVSSIAWSEVKNYADEVIAAIRDAGFDNLILVGNPYWTAAPDFAIAAPPVDSLGNFAMVFHFYSGTHFIDRAIYWGPTPRPTYRRMLESVLDAGLPLFVSEWGTNDAGEGSESYDFAEADKWHEFFDAHKISSCAWGVTASDYNALDYWTADGSPLAPFRDQTALSSWTNPRWMTPHGRYIYHWLTGNDTTFTISGPEFPEYDGPREPIPLTGDESPYANNGSEITMAFEDGVMHVAFELEQGDYEWTPYAGVHLGIDWLSECGWGIGYSYKGSGEHTIRIELEDVADYGYHSNSVPLADADDWTDVRVPWNYFTQPSWAVPVPVDNTKITGISWYTERAAGTTGEYWIKDVVCLGYGEPMVSVRPDRKPSADINKLQPSIRMVGGALRVRMPDNGRVAVYDMRGRQVRVADLSKGDHLIRMNGLPRGTYLIKASGANWSRSTRALVK